MQQVTRTKCGGGIALTAVTTPKFKRAVLRMALLLPLGGEDAALRAALPSVLRRGTVRLPDMGAFGAALDELYGARVEAAVRKEGETLVIGFLADVIDEQYAAGANGLTAQVIRLLADVLYHPLLRDGAFDEAYTAGEKQNLLDRIAAQKNDPRAYAPRRLTELMCSDEAFGKTALGTAEQAEKITPQRLLAAYQRALNTARIELFYCGAMEASAVETLFLEALPARRADGIYVPSCQVVKTADTVRTVTEEMSVTQGKLALGFRTGGHCMSGGDTMDYRVFQTIYGASTSSKLFLNVREKLSLCYYASAQFFAQKGVMIVNSGIENKNIDVAREEILHQLDLCRTGEITKEELDSAQKTLAGAWRALLDDPLQLEHYWLVQAIAGQTEQPEERINKLSGVTIEQVVACAADTALDTVYFLKGVQA